MLSKKQAETLHLFYCLTSQAKSLQTIWASADQLQQVQDCIPGEEHNQYWEKDQAEKQIDKPLKQQDLCPDGKAGEEHSQ